MADRKQGAGLSSGSSAAEHKANCQLSIRRKKGRVIDCVQHLSAKCNHADNL